MCSICCCPRLQSLKITTVVTGQGFSLMCEVSVETVSLNFGPKARDSGSQHIFQHCALNSGLTFWHSVEWWLEQCLHTDLQHIQVSSCGLFVMKVIGQKSLNWSPISVSSLPGMSLGTMSFL